MIFAGAWQWEVAFSDVSADGTTGFNARNLVYAFQWWIFAAFGGWFWYRFLRDQRDAELHELEAAALAAPEQTHDMSAPVEVVIEDQAPQLISLDDSAERRRARAADSLATDAGAGAGADGDANISDGVTKASKSADVVHETGAEGTRS